MIITGWKQKWKERIVDGFLEYFSHFKVRLNQKFSLYKENGKRGGWESLLQELEESRGFLLHRQLCTGVHKTELTPHHAQVHTTAMGPTNAPDVHQDCLYRRITCQCCIFWNQLLVWSTAFPPRRAKPLILLLCHKPEKKE